MIESRKILWSLEPYGPLQIRSCWHTDTGASGFSTTSGSETFPSLIVQGQEYFYSSTAHSFCDKYLFSVWVRFQSPHFPFFCLVWVKVKDTGAALIWSNRAGTLKNKAGICLHWVRQGKQLHNETTCLF